MINKMRNGRGMVAKFGNGTLRVNAYTLQSRYAGQLELTHCAKQTVGSVLPLDSKNIVKNTNKVVLDFSSIASLDVLISELTYLRDEMENSSRG